MRTLTNRTTIQDLGNPSCLQENEAAHLLNENKNQLYYAAYLLVRDKFIAEDIFQEACIRVLRSMRKGNYAEAGKFVPWVARIVRNLSIDHLRQAKKMKKVTMPDGSDIFAFIESGARNQEEQHIHSKDCKNARKVLEQIPYAQREVVVMRIYGDLSFKEIAELTNTGINTVLGRMRYGLLNMKKLIEKQQFKH
jgi:RNA polymerase sigma-70 factor (ECF subfamily)